MTAILRVRAAQLDLIDSDAPSAACSMEFDEPRCRAGIEGTSPSSWRPWSSRRSMEPIPRVRHRPCRSDRGGRIAAYLSAPATGLLIAQRAYRPLALTFVAGFLLNLIGDLVVAPIYGIVGIAVVSAVVYVAMDATVAMVRCGGRVMDAIRDSTTARLTAPRMPKTGRYGQLPLQPCWIRGHPLPSKVMGWQPTPAQRANGLLGDVRRGLYHASDKATSTSALQGAVLGLARTCRRVRPTACTALALAVSQDVAVAKSCGIASGLDVQRTSSRSSHPRRRWRELDAFGEEHGSNDIELQCRSSSDASYRAPESSRHRPSNRSPHGSCALELRDRSIRCRINGQRGDRRAAP